jgi:hypothetical protein
MLVTFEMFTVDGAWCYIEPMIDCPHPGGMGYGLPRRCFLCNRSDGLAVARDVLALYPSLATVFSGLPPRNFNRFGPLSAKTRHAIRHWGGFDGWLTADELAAQATRPASFAEHESALLLTIAELKLYDRSVTVFYKHERIQ